MIKFVVYILCSMFALVELAPPSIDELSSQEFLEMLASNAAAQNPTTLPPTEFITPITATSTEEPIDWDADQMDDDDVTIFNPTPENLPSIPRPQTTPSYPNDNEAAAATPSWQRPSNFPAIQRPQTTPNYPEDDNAGANPIWRRPANFPSIQRPQATPNYPENNIIGAIPIWRRPANFPSIQRPQSIPNYPDFSAPNVRVVFGPQNVPDYPNGLPRPSNIQRIWHFPSDPTQMRFSNNFLNIPTSQSNLPNALGQWLQVNHGNRLPAQSPAIIQRQFYGGQDDDSNRLIMSTNQFSFNSDTGMPIRRRLEFDSRNGIPFVSVH